MWLYKNPGMEDSKGIWNQIWFECYQLPKTWENALISWSINFLICKIWLIHTSWKVISDNMHKWYMHSKCIISVNYSFFNSPQWEVSFLLMLIALYWALSCKAKVFYHIVFQKFLSLLLRYKTVFHWKSGIKDELKANIWNPLNN